MIRGGTNQIDIAVIGSIITDLTVYSDRFPKEGETIQGNEFNVTHGGKGANQCVQAKILGANVALIGKVGDDDFGKKYLDNLNSKGISTDFVGISSVAPTGVAQITVESQRGQNQIIVVPGANLELTVQDILTAAPSTIERTKVMVCQLETNLEATRMALRRARDVKCITVLNPAPMPPNFTPWSDLFTLCHVVCPNEQEATTLTGVPCDTVEGAKKAVEWMVGKGCKWPMVTLGDKGVVMLGDNGSDVVHIPAPTVAAVDSTGAGDSFVGSLSFYLALYPDLPMQEKVRRAIEIASKSVLRKGTQISFFSREELPEELF